MLGEVHSLTHEFPEYENIISKLTKNDTDFASNNKRYNALDKEIRVLELNGAPINDDEMHQLKQQRAELKDNLYHRLVSESR
jgi:uncharacterized protein